VLNVLSRFDSCGLLSGGWQVDRMGQVRGKQRKKMKTYSHSYTPAALIALCGIRKVDVEKAEQAIDATLTGLNMTVKFTGLQKVKGEKGEENAVCEAIARMPQGTIRDVLSYMRDIHRAEKSVKRCGGLLTLSDFPAKVSEWFTGFAATDDDKAAKAAAKAAKLAAKAALEETRKQVEAAKQSAPAVA
jgi:hypothetical protein